MSWLQESTPENERLFKETKELVKKNADTQRENL